MGNQKSKESHVGKQLIDKTSRKVVLCTLLIIFMFPVLDTNTYVDEPSSTSYGIELMHKLAEKELTSQKLQERFDQVVELEQALEMPLIFQQVKLGESTVLQWENESQKFQELRFDEILIIKRPD